MKVDAHLHLWDPARGIYTWLTPDDGPLYAAFSPEMARSELDGAGIDGAVLVQAADSAVDTAYLLGVAADHDWVLGVVGWVDLEDPASAGAELDRWSGSLLKGIRQLVHDDPRPDVLGLPAVWSTLKELAARGLAFDVPNAYPQHLSATIDLARDLDDLTIVVDHLAKPPRGTDEMSEWSRQLHEVAASPRVVAKVSGLHTSAAPYTVDALREVWEIALEAFGPARLMFGSDWPVSVAAEGYPGSRTTLGGLIDELSPDEQDDLWWRTATRVYDLDPPPTTA